MEITWKYEGDDKGMPSDALAEKMEEIQEALRKAMEKDKLSILTGVYTGGGRRYGFIIPVRSVSLANG